jgi:AcrR family transcriptional regulator
LLFLLPSFDEESFRFILRIMKTAALHTFEPRKTPVQNRSTVTVEAIAEATVQVLLAVGLNRLTTTRVADRAGVSVGTLYQYYPNKQALLYAVLEAHSIKVVEAVKHACRANRGAAVKVLVAAVVEAFVNAKLERTDISTALYAAAAEPEGAAVVRRLSKRVHRALTAALADAVGSNVGRHGICSANALFGDGGRDSRGVGGWCATEDGGSLARGVAGALPGVCGEVGGVKLKIRVVS